MPNFIFKTVFSTAALALSLSFNTVQAGEKKPAMQKVDVALDWVPNTNHVGLFVAKQQGFYKQENLEIRAIQPAQTNAMQLVAAGKVHFAVGFAGDLAKARGQGMPLVSIAAIVQENTSCFAWRASANIKDVKGWEGKRYGGWGSPEEGETLKYVMGRFGADFSKLKIVTTGVSDFIPTTEKNADIMWIYMGWDGVRAKLEGIELKTLCIRDLGAPLNQHSPLFITSEKMINKNPDLIRKFLKATALGYTLAIKNPKQAADDFLKQVPEADPKLIRASLDYLAPEYAKGAKHWGIQSEKVLSDYFDWLKSIDRIQKREPNAAYFTNAFLPETK